MACRRWYHLLCCLVLITLSVSAFAQRTYIQADSLPVTVTDSWRYHPGDDPAWRSPAYQDSGWKLRPGMSLGAKKYADAGGPPRVAWFRRYIRIHQQLVGQSLAINLIQNEDSTEIYLDGIRLGEADTFGRHPIRVTNAPFTQPVVFSLPDTGLHLLAIRMAAQLEDDKKPENMDFNLVINSTGAAIAD